MFKSNSTKISIKDEIFIKSGQFALEKKAPFKHKNSYADALILFSFLDFVKINSIENAFFISYNTDDFCEKKEGKNHLHSDLVDEFNNTKSHFYKIVGEALNNIKEDILSKEELAIIEQMQNDAKWDDDIILCQICEVSQNWVSEVHFQSKIELIDDRIGSFYNPKQKEFEFSENLPSSYKPHKQSIEVGHCSMCNSEHFICIECGAINGIWDGEYNNVKECCECGFNYLIVSSYDNDGINIVEYHIFKPTITCEKCGEEFEEENMIGNICLSCEEEYSYGEN
ncbi:hypothetical protein VB776_23960 [Arcicella sp. DC2W]|uniref:DUF4935 domain-containing protein n=1 Tax=Arcicella gelida TaxID=2984195 RepID=A0ABU5SCC7_9BACT|nr:hypothetical protein [Arcicella sp. DC2W]MEA5406016.1 hypothetical protein [Arcicella sp. DC2W]